MAVPPVIRFSQFDNTLGSPSGSRHLRNHASYLKEIGVGASQFLDFGELNLSLGKQSSPTKAVVAMVDDMKDASEAVYNLRLWVAGRNDFVAGTYYFNGWASGIWLQNCALTDASGYFTPTILPSGQNWWRQDGGAEITASGQDSQVTQYMYLSMTMDSDVPNKTYGGDGGAFRYRLTVDYR